MCTQGNLSIFHVSEQQREKESEKEGDRERKRERCTLPTLLLTELFSQPPYANPCR